MRIAIGGISHETNSYATAHTGPTTLDRFDRYEGPALLEQYSGTSTYLGGAIAAAEGLGIAVEPASHAIAEPSGTVTASALRSLIGQLQAALRAAAPVDGVLLELHGAFSAEGSPAADEAVVGAVRAVVGGRTPIAAIFDLHGNVTEELVRSIDLPLATHHNPHSDQAERGAEGVRLLREVAAGRLRPVTAVCTPPMLLTPTTTYHGVGAELLAGALRAEDVHGVVDCSVFHGFPYTDTPAVGSAVVATADGDVAAARRAAADVAAAMWDARRRLLPRAFVGPAAAVAAALEAAEGGAGPVVVNEASDNPGVGAAGDGTHLLRALLEARPAPGTACFGFVVCPQSARAAHAAGPGADLEVAVGAWSSDLAGTPVRGSARVVATGDGRFALTAYAPGMQVDLGPTARLEIGGVDVIVASRPMQTFCPAVFARHGIDVRTRGVVALKSSQHFRDGFEPIASGIVTCDGPGLGTTRLETFPRRHAERPLWPLERDLLWRCPRGWGAQD